MKQKIKRLRSLMEKATPGPWRINNHLGWIEDADGAPITGPDNYRAVTEAVNTLPDLLSHIDALEARVAKAREYGAQARIRENDAQQARVSESLRAMKAERALAEAMGVLRAAESLKSADVYAGNGKLNDVRNRARAVLTKID